MALAQTYPARTRRSAPTRYRVMEDRSAAGRLVTVDWSSLIGAVAQNNDRDAFARLFAHFGPRVKSLMMRNGVTSELAEELAQETMLLVWRKATQFDSSTVGAAAWIFTIARNLRIDAIRRSHPAVPLEGSGAELLVDEAMLPDRLVQVRQDHKRVQHAIARLPAEQVQAIREAYYEEKSHGEIAAQQRMPLGTVKSRLRLAINHLRTILDDDR